MPSIRTFSYNRTSSPKVIYLKSYFNSNLNNEEDFSVTAGAGKFQNSGTRLFGVGEVPNAHYFNGAIAEVIVVNQNINEPVDSERSLIWL